MKIKKTPFNISILDVGDKRVANISEVTASDIRDTSTGDLHAGGLYSPDIFGVPGTRVRNTRHGYISLKVKVFNPELLRKLFKLKGLYKEILEGRGYALFDPKEKDFVRSNAIDGETGFHFFVTHLAKLKFKRNKSSARDLYIDEIEKYRDLLLMDKLIVLPAGLRELEMARDDRPIEHELTKLYRSVLNSAATISDNMAGKEDALLDSTRWNIQRGVLEVYEYLFNMIGGKTGYIQSRWAKRRVFGSTRNVISAMDISAEHLRSERLPDVTTTQIGLHQFIKGTVPLVRHKLRTTVAAEMIASIDGNVTLVDPKTLKPTLIKISQKARDRWTTDDGLEELINAFDRNETRHDPVKVGGYYLALIFNDGKNFKVFNDISELPEEFSRDNVSPLTWAELFYLAAVDHVKRSKAFITRYPVTGLGSIYPSDIYLRTTITGKRLNRMGPGWSTTNEVLSEFPIKGEKFIDTLLLHTVNLPGLGADFDGD